MRAGTAFRAGVAALVASAAVVCGCLETGGGTGFPGPLTFDNDPGGADPFAVDTGTRDTRTPEDLVDATEKLADPPHDGSWTTPDEEGPHGGERLEIDVDIAFSGEYGVTTTDATGIEYRVGDWVTYEDKVYPSEYWGEFPLYYFGAEVGVTVTVTNKGPRNKAKVRVRTEAYVLLTDGSNGTALKEPQEYDIEVMKGESITIDASFTTSYTPGIESGLDRFLVTVLHPNNGDETDWGDAAVITQKEGIFCPPDKQPF